MKMTAAMIIGAALILCMFTVEISVSIEEFPDSADTTDDRPSFTKRDFY